MEPEIQSKKALMYFKPVLIVFLFSCVWLFNRHRYIVSVDDHGNTHAVPQYYTGDMAINCGSVENSTALDGREWIGESASELISGQSRSSVAVEKSFLGVDPVPYMTSRISAAPFHYTFQLNPGQKFIRFHFYPASYRGFERSADLFNVKAGPFTLLSDFSPTHTSARLGVKYLVKEFCLNVEEHGKLSITFSPSQSGKSKNHVIAYAFVNGIEIISMPTGLYYTADGDVGAPIVGQNYRFYSIDNSTALEMVQRLNMGGNFVSSVEDFGMFRRWTADAGFLESGVSLMNYMVPKLEYTNMPLLIAPPKIYQTSWKTARTIGGHQLYSFTWKIPINIGFGYLVRLHFCDLDAAMPDNEQKEFSILVNNQIAETQADVIRWSGGTGFPVYKDYVVMMKGEKEGSECHLFIVLRSPNGLALGLLKGLEIFKLSNLDNCLATPDPASFKKVSTPGNLKIQKFFSLFSQSNVIGTVMTIIILIISTTVYSLRKIWEENVNNENDAELASFEPSFRCFSLADIMLATQNFSDEFIIGRGGFGEVYKGFISGVPKIVAMKRLSFFSRQGAREFWTEIETLSKLRHIHLVSLIGYCNENQEMILVYEYIPGGTLADNLYKFARKGKDSAVLSWEQRLRICIGAARGLEYLHTGSETGIIHRDVKDTNILLDENFIPKISDFGLSILEELTQSKSYVSTNIKGTKGYWDPYYCTTHRLTRKSDVYSFGVVMLVVLSGRPPLETRNPGERESLLACFQECLSNREFDKIVDPNLYQKITPESVKEFVKAVENCLQQQPKNRPTMAQLVGSLEQVLQLQERPVISASGDASVAVPHSELETVQSGEISQGLVATTLEESVASPPPREEITRTKALAREEVHNRVRKPFWFWPWKIVQSRDKNPEPKPPEKAESFMKQEEKEEEKEEEKALSGSLDRYGWPILIDGCNPAFDPKDLQRASAEVLGKGSFGTTFKVTLENGTNVAVKKLKGVTVSKQEFELRIKAVGRIWHENVVPSRAYYNSKDKKEKRIVQDYYSQGSVSALLHGKKGEKRIPLDWEARYRIAVGAARGIARLHEESTMKVVHGNIKASNIFLNSQQYGCVSDLGLATMINPIAPPAKRTAGYRAPEAADTWITSQASDVYSFGVLLLELLTGKSPVPVPAAAGGAGDEGLDLVRWVQAFVRREWTVGAFDLELFRYPNIEGEKEEMLRIGMACVARMPEQRPKMVVVVKMVENIKRQWDIEVLGSNPIYFQGTGGAFFIGGGNGSWSMPVRVVVPTVHSFIPLPRRPSVLSRPPV